METITTTEFQKDSKKYMNEVLNGGMYRVTRHGKEVAYIIPYKENLNITDVEQEEERGK